MIAPPSQVGVLNLDPPAVELEPPGVATELLGARRVLQDAAVATTPVRGFLLRSERRKKLQFETNSRFICRKRRCMSIRSKVVGS
jgi:hypothetical protein